MGTKKEIETCIQKFFAAFLERVPDTLIVLDSIEVVPPGSCIFYFVERYKEYAGNKNHQKFIEVLLHESGLKQFLKDESYFYFPTSSDKSYLKNYEYIFKDEYLPYLSAKCYDFLDES